MLFMGVGKGVERQRNGKPNPCHVANAPGGQGFGGSAPMSKQVFYFSWQAERAASAIETGRRG